MISARDPYPLPADSPFALSPRRVAILVAIALASAVLGYLAGRSLAGNDETMASLAGADVAQPHGGLATRLGSVPAIGRLDIPAPEPPAADVTPTTTSTFPTTSTPAPVPQSAPAPQPAPAPAPAPTPAPSSGGGGGGSFDDSG